MHRYGIEDETWFEAARTGLERRGFRLRLQPRSIIVEKEGRLPRIEGSAREFLEFTERQGLPIDGAAYRAADDYGDGKASAFGRSGDSPFERPDAAHARAAPVPDGVFGRAVAGEAEAAEPTGVEARVSELAAERERLAAERQAAQQVLAERNQLEMRCQALEREISRLTTEVAEASTQRDLYQMSAVSAEDKLRAAQAELEGPADMRGPDKKFNQLRRFLARELHPDLAGEDVAERRLREAIFKRVWAKIEQLH